MSPIAIKTTSLDALEAEWRSKWPDALAAWSRFTQLTEPRFCHTPAEEKAEHLTGSFAMIRLIDHAVVISLRQVVEQRLERFATEILAHEIGHHVYCPADLTDNARMLARMRAGLPTKEHLAPFIANLYGDLLINDRLQRSRSLDIAGVYRAIIQTAQDSMWTLYMRMYELLWNMNRGELARGTIDQRLEYDAQLGARVIRSYSKDWLDGAGRFAALCLPYLMADEAKRAQSNFAPWHDTQAAGRGGVPEGMAEVDPAEQSGAIHPSMDEDLTGVKSDKAEEKQAAGDEGKGAEKIGGRKTLKNYRGPVEYERVLKATGVEMTEKQIIARYYHDLAMPHLVKFPVKQNPQATDPLPEGFDTWDAGQPLEDVDWLATTLVSPSIIPGVTTRQRVFGTSPGHETEKTPIDLYLGVDCSGSMGNPAHSLSYPVLAGAIIALSALKAGSRVMVALSGEPGKTITTDGFVRDEKLVLATLTDYLGTGTTFGIHRLAETFDKHPPTARPVHILIVTDNDVFSMLDRREGAGASQRPREGEAPTEPSSHLGWDVARRAREKARGGATYVLQLPAFLVQIAHERFAPAEQRMTDDGWNVAHVDSMEELLRFARHFSQTNYAHQPRRAHEDSANPS